jgi:hypothetical protein
MAGTSRWHPLTAGALALALGVAALALLLAWLRWRAPDQSAAVLALIEVGVALVAAAAVLAAALQGLRRRRHDARDAERAALWRDAGLLMWRLDAEGEVRDASQAAADALGARSPLDALSLQDADLLLALRRALLERLVWQGESASRAGGAVPGRLALCLRPAGGGESWLIAQGLAQDSAHGATQVAKQGATQGATQGGRRSAIGFNRASPSEPALPAELLQRARALGMDLAQALRRFDGDRAQLERLVDAFLALSGSLPGRLRGALSRLPSGLPVARRELQDLQALAGTLAFERMVLLARSGLGALDRPGGLREDWLPRFEAQLRDELDGLRGLQLAMQALPAQQKPGMPGAQTSPIDVPGFSSDPLTGLLERVRSEDGSAAAWLVERQEALLPWLGEALAPLDAALQVRDFAAARRLLADRYAMN